MNIKNNFIFLVNQFLSQKFTFTESIKLISQEKYVNKKIKTVSAFILSRIECGYDLEYSLLSQSIIKFSQFEINLIAACEKVNCLPSLFDFLYSTEKSKEEIKNKFLIISLYPLLLILMSLAGSFYLIQYGFDLIPAQLYQNNINELRMNSIYCLIKSFSLMMFLFIMMFSIIYILIFKNTDYLLINAFYFLMSSNISLQTTLRLVYPICENTRYKSKVLKMIDKASRGNSLQEIFTILNKKYSLYFELSKQKGESLFALKQIKEIKKRKYETVQKIILSLIEPLSMINIGIFLCMIINGIFVPVFFNYRF